MKDSAHKSRLLTKILLVTALMLIILGSGMFALAGIVSATSSTFNIGLLFGLLVWPLWILGAILLVIVAIIKNHQQRAEIKAATQTWSAFRWVVTIGCAAIVICALVRLSL